MVHMEILVILWNICKALHISSKTMKKEQNKEKKKERKKKKNTGKE